MLLKWTFNHHPRLLYTSRVQRPQPSPLWVPRPPSQCVNHSLEVGACVVLLVALQEGYPQRVLHYRCSCDEFSLRISPRRVSLRCLGAFRSQWKVVWFPVFRDGRMSVVGTWGQVSRECPRIVICVLTTSFPVPAFILPSPLFLSLLSPLFNLCSPFPSNQYWVTSPIHRLF
jgi:hypothetical protein